MKLPNQREMRRLYDEYAGARSALAAELRARVENSLSGLVSRPATVKARVKDFSSYFRKYIRLLKVSGDSPRIMDLVGIRIICPFLEDLDAVEASIRKCFEVVECERKGSGYSFKEFGYESTHLLIAVPADMADKYGSAGCDTAEIQIRTILQDAWAEVEHELVYKAEFTPFDASMKRKLAAVNASLSLADTIFQEIRGYQRQLNGELAKRRESFFRKIGESVDVPFFLEEGQESSVLSGLPVPPAPSENSIDDLLLNALYAHNKGLFDEAVSFYSAILKLGPAEDVCSLIYKHRGMAFFAQSKYADAVDDFTRALETDEKSYKAAYYRGVVRSVTRQYAEAVDDFTISLRINPYQPFCLFRRGQAFYHLGDYPAALSDAEASLALYPEGVQAGKFREFILKKLKM